LKIVDTYRNSFFDSAAARDRTGYIANFERETFWSICRLLLLYGFNISGLDLGLWCLTPLSTIFQL